MKALFSLLLSVIIFTASFQNSLFIIDYKINQAYYEIHCMNKDKPQMDCHGKCQMKVESEKTSNPFSQVKYSFEFNILPQNLTDFEFAKPKFSPSNKEVNVLYANFLLPGYSKIFPHPPQFLVLFTA